MHSPISRLDVQETGLVSAWNKLDTCSNADVLHPILNGDSVHVICHYRWKDFG